MSLVVDEEVLEGGVANPGAVVRVGNTVRRPRKPQTDAVHKYLQYLVDHGLENSVPTPLGYDDAGREQLSYLEGDIALPPHTAWVAGDELLVSVAELQRRVQRVSRRFVPAAGAQWDHDVAPGYVPPGVEGQVVCHNDVCVENVVIRDGRATGLIDFDYAGPVDPLFDTAVAVRHWAPVRDPADLQALDVEVEVIQRFQLFLDVHGLTTDERHRVVDIVGRFLQHAHTNVQRLAAEGHTGFAAMIDDGYLGQNLRSQTWLHANRGRLVP